MFIQSNKISQRSKKQKNWMLSLKRSATERNTNRELDMETKSKVAHFIKIRFPSSA